jgi:CheY-like chemotaxis protein
MPYGKVLIVDDVQTNLDVARGLMEPYGLKVDCVLSGKEAVEAVRNEKVRYDALFMDHMMPEMDGIEATRVIRNEIGTEYSRTVPVIALTANALAGNEEMFLRNGFDAFVSKPIDILRLDAILNQFIRDRQSEQTLRDAERRAEELASLPPPSGESQPLLLPIEGVDIRTGIERYSGEKIFEGILQSYSQHTPGLLQKLSALSFDNLKDYATTVHGLKSASYGILANDIGKRAEELEALSKAGNYDEVLARNADFVRDAKRLVENISSALEAAKKDESQKETKDSIDTELLKAIYESAKHFKTSELEAAVEELNSARYADGNDSELAAWIFEQTENLEYDAICERLEEELR